MTDARTAFDVWYDEHFSDDWKDRRWELKTAWDGLRKDGVSDATIAVVFTTVMRATQDQYE